jgi:hypothetical protein
MHYTKRTKLTFAGKLLALLTLLVLLSGCPGPGAVTPPLPKQPYGAPFDPNAITVDPTTGAEIVSNQVIVRFRDGVARATIEGVITGLGCVIVGEIPELNVFQLRIPGGARPTDLVAQFGTNPHVQWAQVNRIVPIASAGGTLSSSPPNDPYFPQQWALHNTGQSGGRVDADIDAPEAWPIEMGHPDVVIAILDTGVNYEHEDLRDNFRMPTGIVFDFIVNDTDPGDEGDPSRHAYGHGTMMTGVAVASHNSEGTNVGIVGVAPGASFLPVRVLDQWNQVRVLDQRNQVRVVNQRNQVGAVGEGFAITLGKLFAHNKGNAKIINMSFGGPSQGREYLWEEAVNALTRDNDVLLVAAAGNEDSSNLVFPAGFAGVMAVAATDHNDRRSVWGESQNASNYGSWVDVSAPGGSRGAMIWGTTLPHNNSYGYTGGTSSAAAFVSGVAALIWSRDYRDGDFDLLASEVKDIIKDTADPIDHLNPGFEGRLGTGRVNAHRALVEASRRLGVPAPPSATTGQATDVTAASARLNATINPNGLETSVRFEWGTTPAFGNSTPV